MSLHTHTFGSSEACCNINEIRINDRYFSGRYKHRLHNLTKTKIFSFDLRNCHIWTEIHNIMNET